MSFSQTKESSGTDKTQTNSPKSQSSDVKIQNVQVSNFSNADYSTQDENKIKENLKQESEKDLLSNLQIEKEPKNLLSQKSEFENKEEKIRKNNYNNNKETSILIKNTNLLVLDESIISDFKNNINNENLSSISKYLKRGSVKYNENIFYDKNFNPENNQINIINDNIDDLKEINKEIKEMLDKVMILKAKAYLSFKSNKINEAMKDYSNALNAIKITPRIENYLNISNINMTKIECLNNIALCHYVKKDYEYCIDKLNDVLKLNKKNLSALSYKAKALMALERNREALVYIKQALAIKHNKTLYKYLIELENKSKSFNGYAIKNDFISKEANINNDTIIDKVRKPSHIESTEEYRKIFDNSDHSSSNCQHEYFNDKDNSKEFLNRTKINTNTNANDISSPEEEYIIKKNNINNKKMNLKEYEDLLMKNKMVNNYKRNSNTNIFGSIFKFFYLTFKIFIEKIRKNKALLILILLTFIFFKRKNLMKYLRYIINICRGKCCYLPY